MILIKFVKHQFSMLDVFSYLYLLNYVCVYYFIAFVAAVIHMMYNFNKENANPEFYTHLQSNCIYFCVS